MQQSPTYTPGQSFQRALVIESVAKRDGWGLGDGIFKLPAIEDIRAYGAPDCHVDVVCHHARAAIFNNHPAIHAVYPVDAPDRWRTAHALRGVHDLIVMPTIVGRHTALFKALVGLHTPSAYLQPQSTQESLETNHIALYRRLVARTLGGVDETPAAISPQIHLAPHADALARDQLGEFHGTNTIGLFIGAKDPLRHFSQFTAVGRALLAQPDTRIVLFGDHNASAESAAIMQALNAPGRVKNTVGQLPNIETLYACIAAMEVCIGTDSGSLNAAIALQRKVVGLYSYVPSHLRVPIDGAPRRIFDAGCEAGTSQICYRHVLRSRTCHIENTPTIAACLMNMQPQDIAAAALNLLQATNPSTRAAE